MYSFSRCLYPKWLRSEGDKERCEGVLQGWLRTRCAVAFWIIWRGLMFPHKQSLISFTFYWTYRSSPGFWLSWLASVSLGLAMSLSVYLIHLFIVFFTLQTSPIYLSHFCHSSLHTPTPLTLWMEMLQPCTYTGQRSTSRKLKVSDSLVSTQCTHCIYSSDGPHTVMIAG